MKWGLFVLLGAVLTPGIGAGQVPSPHGPEAGNPPHAMMRAAGMPLRDGTLAPGMLTVRIVQGGFTNNLPNQDVTVEVTGGKPQTARTGADGRAPFAHLPIGAMVRAVTTVGGERLTSESFEMPAESGVRVLLIVGDGAVSAPGTQVAEIPLPAGPTTEPPGPVPAPPSVQTTSGAVEGEIPSGVMAVRVIMASATVLAVGFLIFQRRSPSRNTAPDERTTHLT